MPQKTDNSHLERLHRHGLLNNPPHWLFDNLMFEGITGSEAYGCRDTQSGDYDLVGMVIPPKYLIFPHLAGNIPGFGNKSPESFEQYQQHHINDKNSRRTYDFTVYGIVKFFQLTAENNPNMIDNLFLPYRCVTKSTPIYQHIRDNRKLFLSTKAYHTFRGYATTQLAKIKNKVNATNPKRAESIVKYGYDVKFGYHLVRLVLECEQILTKGDLDLGRDAAIYNAIRNGEWTFNRLYDWFTTKEQSLEQQLAKAVVPHSVDWQQIKQLLLDCLEMHYGSLQEAVNDDLRDQRILRDIENILEKYR